MVTTAAAAERGDPTGKRIAVIETFDGFTYKLSITPLKPGASPASSAPDNQLVTVAVSANLPTQRSKIENEKPDDTKAKDEEFAAQIKALNEKLAKEQSLVGRTFELSQNTLSAILKDREALVKKAEPPPSPAPNPASVAKPGAKAIEAVTQPVQVPATKGSKKPAKRVSQ